MACQAGGWALRRFFSSSAAQRCSAASDLRFSAETFCCRREPAVVFAGCRFFAAGLAAWIFDGFACVMRDDFFFVAGTARCRASAALSPDFAVAAVRLLPTIFPDFLLDLAEALLTAFLRPADLRTEDFLGVTLFALAPLRAGFFFAAERVCRDLPAVTVFDVFFATFFLPLLIDFAAALRAGAIFPVRFFVVAMNVSF